MYRTSIQLSKERGVKREKIHPRADGQVRCMVSSGPLEVGSRSEPLASVDRKTPYHLLGMMGQKKIKTRIYRLRYHECGTRAIKGKDVLTSRA